MSRHVVVYLNKSLSYDELFHHIKQQGGYVLWEGKLPVTKQEGVIESGEATIWIRKSVDLSWFQEEMELLKKEKGFEVKEAITIMIGHDEYSDCIAYKFVSSLLKCCGELVMEDMFANYYVNEEINQYPDFKRCQ